MSARTSALLLALLSSACRDWESFSENYNCNGPAVCPSNVTLCDGFEAGLSPETWKPDVAQADLRVEPTCAAGGSKALHIASQGIDAGSAMRARIEADASMPDKFVRAWIRVDTPLPEELRLLDVGGGGGGGSIQLRVDADGRPYIVNSVPASAIKLAPSETRVEIRRWLCIEWQVNKPSGAAQASINVWLDEAEAIVNNQADVPTTTVFNKIGLGPFFSSADSAISELDLFYDEVVLAESRIGCR